MHGRNRQTKKIRWVWQGGCGKMLVSLVVVLLGAIGLPWRWSTLVGEVIDYCLIVKQSGKDTKRKVRTCLKQPNPDSPPLGEETGVEASKADDEEKSHGKSARHRKQNQREHTKQ